MTSMKNKKNIGILMVFVLVLVVYSPFTVLSYIDSIQENTLTQANTISRVVVFSVDAFRHDYYGRGDTPTLDWFLEQGISADYWNDWIGFAWFIGSVKKDGIEATKKEGKAYKYYKEGIPRYTESYSPEEYDNVITEQNKDAIKRLDELVALANQHAENDVSDITILIPIRDEVKLIIYGEELLKLVSRAL